MTPIPKALSTELRLPLWFIFSKKIAMHVHLILRSEFYYIYLRQNKKDIEIKFGHRTRGCLSKTCRMLLN